MADTAKGKRPPAWGWEGAFECPDCGEGVTFLKEEGWEAILADSQWVVQVYHKHGDPDWPEGRWHVALFQKWKGRQRPSIVKDAEAQKKAAYNREKEAREIRNAEVS